VDVTTLQKCFRRAAATYDAQAQVQKTVAAHLWHMIADHIQPGVRLLEIGAGTGMLTRHLFAAQPSTLTLNDVYLSPQLTRYLHSLPHGIVFLEGDAMVVDWGAPYDAIVSASTFQWFSDLDSLFARCAHYMRPGGMLAFSSFLPGTLGELTRLTGVGLHYANAQELRYRLSPLFDILTLEESSIVLHFATPRDVLTHLRETGVTGCSKPVGWNTRRYAAFVKDYAASYSDEKGMRLTYRPVYVLAQRTATMPGKRP